PEAIARALPSLRSALGNYDTAQGQFSRFFVLDLIKQSDPQFLVVALKMPLTTYDAADALGDLGTESRFALPALYEAMDGSPSHVRRAIENAIKRIDPNAPKLLFNCADNMLPAFNALMEAANTTGGELRGSIVDVYEKHTKGQDGYRDILTRSEVIAFAQAVRDVDQRAYNLFVAKLVEYNPSLADALKTCK